MVGNDSFGDFLDQPLVKIAEIEFPSVNIPIYQEKQDTGNSGDVIEYAEPWGGKQNRPYVNPAKPDELEQDKSITQQGERPQTYLDTKTPEELPATTTTNFGQQWEKTPDPGAGSGSPPGPDMVFVKPRGDGADPFNLEVHPVVTGEPYSEDGSADEEQTFVDRVYYASSTIKKGDTKMSAPSQDAIRRVVASVVSKTTVKRASVDNSANKLKIAFLEDLYPFDRVSSEELIHKSSRELWKIGVDEDGDTIISKEFDENGDPIQV